MLKIHHVPGTRSIRVIWLCEELGLPYEIVKVDFSPAFRASPEWRRLSPSGKVPVMEDDGFSMFESGAMVQYILERYGEGRLQPEPGTAESALYLQWCWFAEATLARPMGLHAILRPEAERSVALVEDAMEKALLCLDALEGALEGGEFLLGASFTAADIMTGYSLRLARLDGVLGDRHPRVLAYLQRLESRPAFARAIA